MATKPGWKLPWNHPLQPTQLLHLISAVQDFGLASIGDMAHEPAMSRADMDTKVRLKAGDCVGIASVIWPNYNISPT